MNNKLIFFLLNILFIINIEKCLAQEKHTFIHPGGWVSAQDIQRIRTKLHNKDESILKAKEALMKLSPDHDYKPQPVEEVIRETGGVGESDKHLRNDSTHAFTLMITWIATNDSRYGDAAIRVIDGWSEVLSKNRRKRCQTRIWYLWQPISPGGRVGRVL